MTITEIGTLLGVVVLIYKAFTMTPREALNVGANTLKQMEEVVASSIDRSMKLNERVVALETSEALLKSQLSRKDDLITALNERITDLENIVDRLTHQVQSLGGKPVVTRKENTHGTT